MKNGTRCPLAHSLPLVAVHTGTVLSAADDRTVVGNEDQNCVLIDSSSMSLRRSRPMLSLMLVIMA